MFAYFSLFILCIRSVHILAYNSIKLTFCHNYILYIYQSIVKYMHYSLYLPSYGHSYIFSPLSAYLPARIRIQYASLNMLEG
ncbi:hypothetical protein XENTR_v10006046 [Xenopus tropicalis]|nr:hypothetical protein XENTR_v10006046 [Xenopus tropicalis]